MRASGSRGNRWSFVTGIAAVALTACGGSAASSAPKEIAAKVSSSTMSDAEFTVTGTIGNGAIDYPVTGTGVFELKPKNALELNLQLDTGGLVGRIDFDEIVIGRTQYSRIGAAAWKSQADSNSGVTAFDGSTAIKQIGEDSLALGKAWHLETTSTDGTIWDEWVRETDGYLLKMTWKTKGSSSGVTQLTVTMSGFNKGADIVAPI